MFNLAECQKRIRFFNLFSDWVSDTVAKLPAEDTRYNQTYFLRTALADRVKSYGVKVGRREIISEGNSCYIRAILTLASDTEWDEGRYVMYFNSRMSMSTTLRVYFDFIYTRDWDFETYMVGRFFEEMRDLPGYDKAFDDIERE